MKRSKFSESQVTYALRQADPARPRPMSADGSESARRPFTNWKKYAGLDITELREIRQLREENAKLKRLVADLRLDEHILSEGVRKKSEASASP